MHLSASILVLGLSWTRLAFTSPVPFLLEQLTEVKVGELVTQGPNVVFDATPPVDPKQHTLGEKSKRPKHDTSPEKHFFEAPFNAHYDGRFGKKELSYINKKAAIASAARAYLTTMKDIGAETWIMHGSLLGWWWNKKSMPWDNDMDVQMSLATMDYLAEQYNMTIHIYEGREYMLEINPHYRNASTAEVHNRIDGRWVDKQTGLYIDITAFREDERAQKAGNPTAMMSKDGHRYSLNDIYPLREEIFEGVPCLIPYGYSQLLTQEYGAISLTRRLFMNHIFDSEKKEWILQAPRLKFRPSVKP